MIPIADSVRSRSFPIVNVTLIVLNILVFMYEVYLSQQTIVGRVTELDRFIADWGNIPACTFDAFGFGVDAEARTCGDQPDPRLTPLSAMFLHGSWLHLLSNMLFLWIFGDNVEDAMGHTRYVVFYLLGGLLAALAHGLFNANDLIPAVGASGAIAAVMGAYLLLFPRATVRVVSFVIIPIPLPAFVLIGFWFLTQLYWGVASLGVEAVGAGGGVAYFAHIGGLIAGAALVRLFVIGRAGHIGAMKGRG